MCAISKFGVPLLSLLPLGVLLTILRYLDPRSLFNTALAWKSAMNVCRKDPVLSSRIREHVKTEKTKPSVQKRVFYQQTPLLRQRDREQFKIPRVRLYRVILEEEKRRGGEEIKVPKRSVRYQPYNRATKGIRI